MNLAGLRIGLPKEYFGEGVDADVLARVREAVRWFESQGAKTVEITLPNTGARGAGLLRDRAGGSLVQPVALRRRALWPPRARTTRT